MVLVNHDRIISISQCLAGWFFDRINSSPFVGEASKWLGNIMHRIIALKVEMDVNHIAFKGKGLE